jgi:hypothetical protein
MRRAAPPPPPEHLFLPSLNFSQQFAYRQHSLPVQEWGWSSGGLKTWRGRQLNEGGWGPPPAALALRPPAGITPPDQGDMAATLQVWLNEFERVRLRPPLSARLRQKRND